MVNDLMNLVESFARQRYNIVGDDSLWTHVELVRKYALMLADKLRADKLVVEIAALLHDIGKDVGRETHHLRGYSLAKTFLDTIKIPDEKKYLILKCILKHRSRFSGEDNELEVKIIQSADGLGLLFDNFWQEDARKKEMKPELLRLYDKTMKKINLDYAKEIAKPRVAQLKKLLSIA